MTTRNAVRPEDVLHILKTNFEVPPGTTADSDFTSLDLDSLVLIELAVVLTKRYGVEVAEHELAAADTAVKVAELLAAKGANG